MAEPGPGPGLQVEIALDPDADATELQSATAQLQQELLELDVDDVTVPPGEAPPPGTRAIELAILGTLAVKLGRGAIDGVVTTLLSWVGRDSSRSVKVTLDGDTIELTNASDDDQRRLVESFLARHAETSM